MSARLNLLFGAALIMLLAVGCQEPTRRLHAPPQGATNQPHPMQDDLIYMVDNAMLHDMSVADIHFVPHTTQINSLGIRRLNRYAELLLRTGGTIHCETAECDEEMTQARIESVKKFLADAGLDMDKVKVEGGLSRGRGTRATGAIRIMQKGTVEQTQ